MYIMPNYQQSKIYKIISNNTDKIYIGSTTNQYLANRKSVHKAHYQMWKDDNTKQYCSSFELYDLGDVEYILLEAYECNSKDELRARERYWVEQNINNVVNINRPVVSKEETNQRKKVYNVENKEHLAMKKKEYALEHKDEIEVYQQNWRAENKEKYDEARKKWADKNRELINQRAKERRLQKKAANN
jgi:hypothetical protein